MSQRASTFFIAQAYMLHNLLKQDLEFWQMITNSQYTGLSNFWETYLLQISCCTYQILLRQLGYLKSQVPLARQSAEIYKRILESTVC